MITSPLFLIRQSRRVERRVRAITIAIVFFVMLGWQCGLSALAAASPVVAHFDVPGSSPRGLTWDGTHLWMVDNLKTVYQLDTSGNVLSSFKIAFSPSGMCWDGQALWIGDDTGSRQVKLDRQGSVLGTMSVWYWDDSGVAWDGTNFWIGDYNFSEMHMIDPSGVEIRYWRIFASNEGGIEHPTGIVSDGGTLWTGDSNEGLENNVARFSKTGVLLNSFNTTDWGIPPVTWPEFKVFAWNGRYLWYSADDLFVVYCIDVTALPDVQIAPIIVTQPTNSVVQLGKVANLSVVATAAPTPSYRWRHNGVNLSDGGRISGSGTSALSISNVISTDAGVYDVIVSNAIGTATSIPSAVTVPGPPLAAMPTGNRLQLSWPTNAVGFTLQGTAFLDHPTWTPLTNQVTRVGSRFQAFVEPSQSQMFFRLVR